MQFYTPHNKQSPPMPQSRTAPQPICLTLLLVAASLLSDTVGAEQAGLCPEIATGVPWPAVHRKQTDLTDTALHVYANEVEVELDRQATFTGNVELLRAGTRITADRLTYDKLKDEVQAFGRVNLTTDRGDSYETDKLFWQPQNETGHTGSGSFLLRGQGRGEAGRMNFEPGQMLRMQKVRYTTCAPGDNDWYLSVKELDLDRDEDIGKAYHGTVRFQGVPIFYWPYLDFPLSGQRKSGFLAPQIGNNSNLGAILGTPYYFNLAPNYDDTLTPRVLSKRGVQLQNEFRYLGRRLSGQLDLEHLPNDREYFDDDRSAAGFRHHQFLGTAWTADADLNWVSDDDYLDDFGDSLAVSARTHLPENVVLGYQGRRWQFSGRAAGFKTVDKTITSDQEPYELLPELRLWTTAAQRPNRINAGVDTAWTRFEHDELITGGRFNLDADLSLPLHASYGFFTPTVGGRYLDYDLSSTPEALQSPPFEETLSETFGYFSLDTGLFFDREYRWRDKNYIHTLEPRLFYLYAPYEDQDGLPVFDTGLPDFTFSSVFRNNRFVGGDRFGDANQATVALTSRILDGVSGAERFRASLGQIYYFRDRLVTLEGGPPETSENSDIVAEVAARLASHWYLRGTVQWDTDQNETEKGGLSVQYHPQPDRIVNLGYRRIRDELPEEEVEQTELSFAWPVSSRWSVQGGWKYSLVEDTNLESSAGLEYRSCCWALRVSANRRLSSDGNQVNSYLIQLELSGLADIGDESASPLQKSVFDF